MRNGAIGVVLCALAAGLWGCAAQPEELTYEDLTERLYDLPRLAKKPPRGYTTQMFSSYDRSSYYDATTGEYESWKANRDGGGVVREEDGKLVLAEMTGPGCIWRIWSAWPGDGHVRVYIDGDPRPRLDMPFKNYFTPMAPYYRPELCYTSAKGWNCYVPIPFQRSCKIVADPNFGGRSRYFQITYSRFAEGSTVESYPRDLTARHEAALDKANDRLALRGENPHPFREGQQTETRKLTVAPGESVTLADLEGPSVIYAIKARYDLPETPEDVARQRKLIFSITWDDEDEPAVWCPLADFFGTPGENAYRSLATGLTRDGKWYSYWYMPFRKAVIRLANDGDEPQSVSFEITHAPLREDEKLGDYARFHAKFHRGPFAPPEPGRRIDWPLLKTEGRGRFVGVMLHVWNPLGRWWGEGDEKFYVDGETFPSTFGTGTEDYFGYAWGDPSLFGRPFHSQSISMNNAGHIGLTRWHIPDDVPFQDSFFATIEKWFPDKRPTRYAAVAYWYLAPGGQDPYGPVPLSERVGYFQEDEATRYEGVIEGESLDYLPSTRGGFVQTNHLGENGRAISGDVYLWWTHQSSEGEHLDLPLVVDRTGSYRLSVRYVLAPAHGIYQPLLDGEPLGKAVDLYNEKHIGAKEMNLGVHRLQAGPHILSFRYEGKNENARYGWFGLDYVQLEPTEGGNGKPSAEEESADTPAEKTNRESSAENDDADDADHADDADNEE